MENINKIIKLIIVILLFTSLSSCILFKGVKTETQTFEQKDDSILNGLNYFVTSCDSIPKSNKFGYQNIRFQTYTFSSKTLVYCSPMENSRVVDTISVNAELRGRRTITNNNVFWLEIFHEGKTKYIKRADTRIESYFFSKNDILLGKKNDSIYSIKVIDIEKNEELDSYDFEIPINNREDSNATYLINRTKLIGGKYIFRYKTNNQDKYKNFVFNEFVLLDDRKIFFPLLKSKSFTYKKDYLKDNYLNESIYIPISFEDGNILLVKNGDLDNIFDKQTGKLNIMDCPERFKKFEENLIVKRIESQYHKLDENGEPMYDEYGDEMYITTKEIICYQWDGTKLVKVK